jgi:hypothetical protein
MPESFGVGVGIAFLPARLQCFYQHFWFSSTAAPPSGQAAFARETGLVAVGSFLARARRPNLRGALPAIARTLSCGRSDRQYSGLKHDHLLFLRCLDRMEGNVLGNVDPPDAQLR